MQSTLLDLLIIGLLVIVFGSIYRGHATARIRFWLLGWLFVLLHFGLQLFNPSSDLIANLMLAAGMSALLLCGVAFLLSSGLVWERGWSFAVPVFLLSMPAVAFVTVSLMWGKPMPLMFGLALAAQAGYAAVTMRFGRVRPVARTGARVRFARRWSAAILTAGTLWLGWLLLSHQVDYGMYAILCEVYLLNAVLYWEDFRHATAGVLTSVVGLAAWGMVFPAAMFLAWLFPHLQIDGELWNVPKYFVALGMILTLLEEQKREADDQFEEYRLLFENNPHPMWIFDTETLHFLTVNDAAKARYGYTEEEFRRMTLRDIRPQEDIQALEQAVRQMEPSDAVNVSGPWTHILSDGRRIQAEVASHSIRFRGRQARFSLVQDVTERQELHHKLLHQAHHDMLTDLPNRLLLVDRMEQALATAERNNRKVAVICLDLDRFKQVNDTYGHAVGDLCLKQVANRLRSRLRSADTVARSGGEEFTIVAGGLSCIYDAMKIAEDLTNELRNPLLVDQYPIDVSGSFGVAVYPDHGAEAGELWRNADAAMYRAKRSGGNQYVLVSQEISLATTEANELELFMRRALKEGGLEVYYQPEYATDGTLRGLEALLRLHHPRFGMVGPDRFIPIAEESGLIVPVGYWVVRDVCRQSEEWRRQGLPVPLIAINVSPLQFMRVDFAAQVREVLSDLGVWPENLEIEVTETAVMRNLDEVARQMRELAELGVHFAVDDFGTGYSSLQRLQQLPIRTLKIDRIFVERVCEPGGSSALVQATLSLAHSLGLQVVAEGVEREEQAEALAKMNCDVLQGYLFGPPQPAAAMPDLMRAGRVPARWQGAVTA